MGGFTIIICGMITVSFDLRFVDVSLFTAFFSAFEQHSRSRAMCIFFRQ